MIPAQFRHVPLVYFVRIKPAGPIKVGVTKDLERRCYTIQNSLPYPLALLAVRVCADYAAAERVERTVHARLARYRMRGEWYRPHRDVLHVIAAMPDVGSGSV